MHAAAKEVDRPEAFPYKTKLHAFHGGQVSNANVFPLRTIHEVVRGHELVRFGRSSDGNL